MIIDTHCHLHDDAFAERRGDAGARPRARGVGRDRGGLRRAHQPPHARGRARQQQGGVAGAGLPPRAHRARRRRPRAGRGPGAGEPRAHGRPRRGGPAVVQPGGRRRPRAADDARAGAPGPPASPRQPLRPAGDPARAARGRRPRAGGAQGRARRARGVPLAQGARRRDPRHRGRRLPRVGDARDGLPGPRPRPGGDGPARLAPRGERRAVAVQGGVRGRRLRPVARLARGGRGGEDQAAPRRGDHVPPLRQRLPPVRPRLA